MAFKPRSPGSCSTLLYSAPTLLFSFATSDVYYTHKRKAKDSLKFYLAFVQLVKKDQVCMVTFMAIIHPDTFDPNVLIKT